MYVLDLPIFNFTKFHEILGLEGDFVSLLVAVRAFHASLLEMKLFNENEAKVLLDYVDNINETFVNQRCQSLLGQARILMKKDLHVAGK